MTRSPTTRQQAFVDWLGGLVEQRRTGTLAVLRRGLMLEEEQLYGLLGHLPPNFFAGMEPWEEQLYLMVAALFAYHPLTFSKEELEGRRRNLGESMFLLAQVKRAPDAAPDDPPPDPLRRRMEAVLAAPRDELFGHLRQIISLLKSAEIRVDWAQLLSDLYAWEWDGRPVQWAWSRSFYVGHVAKEGEKTHVS